MKYLLLLSLIYTSIESHSNNLEKILNKSELDSLSKGFEIYKYTRNFDGWDGFEGKIRIKSINSKLIYATIDEWKKYYNNTQNLKAYYKFDSIGCLQVYKEFNETGLCNYDCIYSKKHIGNNNYLIETINLYYDNGRLNETGQRFKRVEYSTGYIHHLENFIRYGEWISYNYDGTIFKKKKYRKFE